MKNFKKVLCIGFILASCILFPKTISASAGSVSVRSSVSSAIVGRTFNVTVTVSNNAPMASWEYTLAYDTTKLEMVSGDAYVMEFMTKTDVKSKSYTYVFRAKASGNANIYIQSAAILDWNGAIGVSKGSRTIKIQTQAEIEASYSKNNYLSTLGVTGYQITPSFQKDTLEYHLEVEPDVTKVILEGKAEDGKSSIDGLGEKEVSEGANRFEIKVTAQNGNVRTYIVTVQVKEYNPIEIKIGNQTLKVVRKKTDLTPPANYQETIVKIKEEEVPGFYSEITKYTLVGLKDSEGKIAFYIYDENKETYTLYQEFSMNQIKISLIHKERPFKRYHPTKIKIDEMEIPVYKLKDSSFYALLYGMNVATGKENWYLYDSMEHTLQIYHTEEVTLLEEESTRYFQIGIALGGISLLLLISLIISLVNRKKHGKNEQDEGYQEKKHKHKKKNQKKMDMVSFDSDPKSM